MLIDAYEETVSLAKQEVGCTQNISELYDRVRGELDWPEKCMSK